MSILDTDKEILEKNGMSKKKRDISLVWLWIVIGVLLCLMSLSIVIYCNYFQGGISTEHQRWGEYGDYISGIAGLLNFIAFCILTVLIHTIDKKNEKQNTRLYAEKLVIKKFRSKSQVVFSQYVAFLRDNSRVISMDTFEYLQPLMSYMFFLKGIDFLPQKTKDFIVEFHSYLFDASDNLYSYALDVETNKGEKLQPKDVLKTYRALIQKMEHLDVLLCADIAGVSKIKGDEKYDKEIDEIPNRSNK